ncbi:MAG: type II toxin-antitoxin system VapB family antitoxin [Candidatus Cyclonatronum sp.]|uniref:type II toxin-antitoxin system VapB family antitoxin n=1 Tax=Cyclonatronum sp. TaxID=3024185 RepID=UPI0025C577F3|nr:type II toxin-antitoxin system VapB family antitoxin [Cyclonatronum sp.]MCH8487477.1 type II toxin-antitoxin system VapB family antitoxin [Cyclonatronum sp.]
MRTNIDIDNKLMDEAVKYSGLSTKKEIVHEALRVLVQREKQKRIRNYRGKLSWEGDLDEMRESKL